MILKGSMGLGDAIYLYPMVKYYSEMYPGSVTIITRYPEIYANLNCQTAKPDEYIDCSCSARTKEESTNIYEDTLIMSKIINKLPFKFEYDKTNQIKINSFKKICVVRNITTPANGEEDAKVMIPKISVFQNIINAYSGKVFFVSIGWQKSCDYKLDKIDLDLSEINVLNSYFSVIDQADIVLSQPGHCVPIAEGLNKKLFCVFARSGLKSMEKRFRFTTPQKILTKISSTYCVDDEKPEDYLPKFEKLLFGD